MLLNIFLVYKSSENKTLENVKLKEVEKIPKGLAIMIEKEHNSNDYEESNTSSWPKTGYKFNKEKSGCIDNSGSTIENSLSYDSVTNIVTVDTGVTTKCYIYFDKRYSLESLCASGEDTLGECLTNNNSTIESLNDNVEGGLYRYQGTQELVDDNYICFGTTSKEECTSNTDAYMYRIIGIDENNQLKLIKKEALNEAMQWYSDKTQNIIWPNSIIYSNVNGEKYLTNSTYIPSGWENKIVDYKWKYGDIDDTNINVMAPELYNVENDFTGIINAKIGLMYAHDYVYGMSGGNNCSYSGGQYGICKTSWIHLNNNDKGAPLAHEWAMTRFGYGADGYYYVWLIASDGSLFHMSLNASAYAIRPVFYLTTNETYASGNGTIEDPIIIGKTKGLCENGDNLGNCLIENNSEIKSLDNTAYSGMYRYTGTNEVVNNNYICFGTSNKTECLNNPEKYMYRMIGVTSENNTTLGLETGQVKLIKDTSIGTHEWNSSYKTNTKWESSTMYTYLQNDVLSNTSYIPSEWNNKISSVKWNIGDVQTYTDGSTVYELEKSLQTTNTSKVGLMYLSDYYYAYIVGGETNCNSISCKSWLTDTLNRTWTMIRYGDYGNINYVAWYVGTSGLIDLTNLSNTYAIRPVFYLNSDEVFVSGMGTENDPIIIKGPPAGETIIRKDTENNIGLQQEIITGDDLYRFSGIQGNTGINNYVCLGTTSKCESGSDNMYRIIGVNPNNGELKVIKEIKYGTNIIWNSSREVTYPNSNSYNAMVTWYNSASFKNIIVEHKWNIGDINGFDDTYTGTRQSVLSYEENISTTAYVGMLALSDYYLAYKNDQNWFNTYSNYQNNWIHLANNGNIEDEEWTMIRYGTAGAWYIHNDGYVGSHYVYDYSYAVRPVFYLKLNVYITNPAATGSSTDPFILAY